MPKKVLRDGEWRDQPSVARWRASRARRQALKRAVNVIQWRNMAAIPPEWDSWSEEQQLKWAREVLAKLAVGAENEKTQTLAAGSLARSLEPKGRPATGPSKAVDGAAEGKRSPEYLRALRAEIDAELEKLKGGEH